MVKHQHAPAAARREHLEPGPIVGERIGPVAPGPRVVRPGRVDIVFAIVEDDFEHPVAAPRIDVPGAPSRAVQQRRAVAVMDALEMAVGGAAIKGEDVVLGEGAPVHVPAVVDIGPAFDAGKQPFDTRPVTANPITVQNLFMDDRLAIGPGLPVSRLILTIDRNQILGPRKDEDVRLLPVEIARQALVGLVRALSSTPRQGRG